VAGAPEPAALEVLQVPQELFTVELREGTLLLRVQIASAGFRYVEHMTAPEDCQTNTSS
jgi:hypothetical protein